jgi:hypothetical protein
MSGEFLLGWLLRGLFSSRKPKEGDVYSRDILVSCKSGHQTSCVNCCNEKPYFKVGIQDLADKKGG